MADNRDQPVLVRSGEEARLRGRGAGRRDAVAFAVQHDCRHRDRRPFGKLALQHVIGGVARRVTEAMAVGVDDDVDEIRIVEGVRRAVIGGVVEVPVRRPQLPQQLAQFAPVGLQPGAAAFGVEIILVPEPVFLLRRRRHDRSGDVLDTVAVGQYEAAHALGPQRGGDAGGAPAPVETGKDRRGQRQRVHQLHEIAADRGLLAGARRVGFEKARLPIAAQIGHDHPVPGPDQRRRHLIESAGIVRKAVHQQHRKAGLGPTLLVGDFQDAGARAFEHCSPGLLPPPYPLPLAGEGREGGRRGGGRHEADEQTTVDHSGIPRVVASKEDIT